MVVEWSGRTPDGDDAHARNACIAATNPSQSLKSLEPNLRTPSYCLCKMRRKLRLRLGFGQCVCVHRCLRVRVCVCVCVCARRGSGNKSAPSTTKPSPHIFYPSCLCIAAMSIFFPPLRAR